MGVTIESKNHSIDLGYGGFNNIRTKVAELSDAELGLHYKNLKNAPIFGDRDEFFKKYNKKINEIVSNNNALYPIADFIYQSDCGGEGSTEHCKQIYEVIKDYDDNVLYGYCGRKDCAMFKDFKEIIKDCIDNDCSMTWF